MEKLKTRYRYSVILLKQLVKTDFKLRYQNSMLGYIWSLLRPFLLFVTLYLVFTIFLKVGKGVPHYPVYLLVGIVLWNYFAEVTSGSIGAIVGRGDLLRKINFPKYVIIMAGSVSALINLMLNTVVIAVFMIFSHISISWRALIVLPLIVELAVLSIGVAFLLSTLYVRFRDVNYIWEVVMQAAFYATPILYPITTISNIHLKVAKALMLNPMAQIIQDVRYVLVTRQTTTIGELFHTNWIWAVPLGITVLLVTLSSLYFRSRSKYFAEEA